jgi:hypothetical protein
MKCECWMLECWSSRSSSCDDEFGVDEYIPLGTVFPISDFEILIPEFGVWSLELWCFINKIRIIILT